VLATEVLATVRCGFLSIAETADLAQIHSFLQIAGCQNQPRSSRLQLHESKPKRISFFLAFSMVVERLEKNASKKLYPSLKDYLTESKPSEERPAFDAYRWRTDMIGTIERQLTDLNENIRAMPITTPNSFRQACITTRELLHSMMKLYPYDI
jgi:hypothetical protein